MNVPMKPVLVVAVICGVAYYLMGPVGIGIVAICMLLKY